MAALEIPRISSILELTDLEQRLLHFLVAKHGEAHSWNDLTPQRQCEIKSSPWKRSMALLQEADARSCILENGEHKPIFWKNIVDD